MLPRAAGSESRFPETSSERPWPYLLTCCSAPVRYWLAAGIGPRGQTSRGCYAVRHPDLSTWVFSCVASGGYSISPPAASLLDLSQVKLFFACPKVSGGGA